jgi:hypothetical protein
MSVRRGLVAVAAAGRRESGDGGSDMCRGAAEARTGEGHDDDGGDGGDGGGDSTMESWSWSWYRAHMVSQIQMASSYVEAFFHCPLEYRVTCCRAVCLKEDKNLSTY